MQVRKLSLGQTEKVYDYKVDGTLEKTKKIIFNIDDAESCIFSLWVNAISGTLNVRVFTHNSPGERVLAVEFPAQTLPTPNLLLERTGAITSQLEVEIEVTDTADLTLYVTGISSGELNTRIVPNSEFGSTQITVPAGVPTVLVPASTADQSGIVIRNYGRPGETPFSTRFADATTDGVLFVNSTSATANGTEGYPINPGESLQLEVGAGVAIFGFSVLARDVRLLSAGA